MIIASDPSEFERLSLLPGIREAVLQNGRDSLDLSAAWPRCTGLLWPGEGGFLFVELDDDGLWEVHTLFEDSRRALERAQEAAHHVFIHGCDKLTTRVPFSNVKALRFAEKVGMRFEFSVQGVWDGPGGLEGVNVLSWHAEDWIAHEPTRLETAGASVHAALAEGGFHTNHGDDPVHERFVGFVAECYRAGTPSRGVYYYNRWAVSCGYLPIRYLDASRAAFGDVKISMAPDGAWRVERCQPEQS